MSEIWFNFVEKSVIPFELSVEYLSILYESESEIRELYFSVFSSILNLVSDIIWEEYSLLVSVECEGIWLSSEIGFDSVSIEFSFSFVFVLKLLWELSYISLVLTLKSEFIAEPYEESNVVSFI